jgi:ABC-type transport system substrate-binding protein
VTDFNQVGVHAEDPHTLKIELIGPTPYFLSAILHTAWFPVHMPTILKFGKMNERDTKWTEPGNYVGTGPFILKTWRQNDVIEVVRNPLYWDAATVKLNGINFYSIESTDTQERAFEAGQLHKTLDVPLDRVPYYRREHPELIRIDPYEGVYFYRLNVQRKPLDDPRVRLALNLAVNRSQIVTDITRGKQHPATGVTHSGMEGYEPLDEIHYDPEQARRLLAEAGYPNGKGFPKFNILISTYQAHLMIAEAVQQMWKQELNIDVGIENQEWKVYLESQNSMNYDIARYALSGLLRLSNAAHENRVQSQNEKIRQHAPLCFRPARKRLKAREEVNRASWHKDALQSPLFLAFASIGVANIDGNHMPLEHDIGQFTSGITMLFHHDIGPFCASARENNSRKGVARREFSVCAQERNTVRVLHCNSYLIDGIKSTNIKA